MQFDIIGYKMTTLNGNIHYESTFIALCNSKY